jgi:hydroxymethylpyrimidine/phosphomethylpyrimidine kinase
VLVEEVLPRATVVTPNVPEARALAGHAAAHEGADGTDRAEVATLARAIHARGPRVVLVTGGHRDEAADLFFDGEQVVEIPGTRHPDGAAHGSGCTHSSLLAGLLARGAEPLAAARLARELAGEAVRRGLRDIGRGAGPVDVIDLAERRRAVGETGWIEVRRLP